MVSCLSTFVSFCATSKFPLTISMSELLKLKRPKEFFCQDLKLTDKLRVRFDLLWMILFDDCPSALMVLNALQSLLIEFANKRLYNYELIFKLEINIVLSFFKIYIC
jgi:hypothetical protein